MTLHSRRPFSSSVSQFQSLPVFVSPCLLAGVIHVSLAVPLSSSMLASTKKGLFATSTSAASDGGTNFRYVTTADLSTRDELEEQADKGLEITRQQFEDHADVTLGCQPYRHSNLQALCLGAVFLAMGQASMQISEQIVDKQSVHQKRSWIEGFAPHGRLKTLPDKFRKMLQAAETYFVDQQSQFTVISPTLTRSGEAPNIGELLGTSR